MILVDDAARSEERKIVEMWQREFPKLRFEKIDAEKGAVRITQPDDSGKGLEQSLLAETQEARRTA